MDILLRVPKNKKINEHITISGSKSESNRLLILQQLFDNLTVKNLSNSDDTKVMQKILSSNSETADVHHAGTAMRFLTAFFASKENREVILTGSKRMQERPIKILVDALRDLGAEIIYEKTEGFPPIKIKGKRITTNEVSIQGNVSSQYISALMLIAPSLPNGLTIQLLGKITSVPYIKMTLSLLKQLGVTASFKDDKIAIKPQLNIKDKTMVVEADWSSASYWYSLISLAEEGSKITLSAYKEESLQGDSCLAEIYEHFGVKTTFSKHNITLLKTTTLKESKGLTVDLKSAPDIAQTIAVTCFGLGLACDLSGLHTLKIKETDRLEALKEELTKLGAEITVTEESLHLKASEKINEHIAIKTYNDHRMAMAFAPLAIKVPIKILNAEVVSKSYVDFWTDFAKVGIKA